jgi:hypothetical protein
MSASSKCISQPQLWSPISTTDEIDASNLSVAERPSFARVEAFPKIQ